MDKEHLALEAARLAKDPVFIEVLKRIRSQAVESLVVANVEDQRTLLSLQAFAKVCDVFPQELEAMIASGHERKLHTVV